MALELNIAQSNYCRLEKDDDLITVPKLLKVVKILDISVSYLFDENPENIIHYNNDENVHSSINILCSNKEYIHLLKEEIEFLKKILDKNE